MLNVINHKNLRRLFKGHFSKTSFTFDRSQNLMLVYRKNQVQDDSLLNNYQNFVFPIRKLTFNINVLLCLQKLKIIFKRQYTGIRHLFFDDENWKFDNYIKQ